MTRHAVFLVIYQEKNGSHYHPNRSEPESQIDGSEEQKTQQILDIFGKPTGQDRSPELADELRGKVARAAKRRLQRLIKRQPENQLKNANTTVNRLHRKTQVGSNDKCEAS